MKKSHQYLNLFKSQRLKPFALILICLSMLPLAGANTQPPFLTYDDVFNIEYANNPSFHPTSNTLIYERVSFSRQNDKQVKSLWRMDLDTKSHTPLFSFNKDIKSSFSPEFSNAGDRIAFLGETENGVQIFIYDFSSRSLFKISELEQTPNNLVWSPDDSELAFTMFSSIPSPTLFDDLPIKPKGAKWAGKAKYIDSVSYRSDGRGYTKPGFTQIYKIDASGGTAKQLTNSKHNHSGPLIWMEAGNKNSRHERIIFVSNREKNWQMKPLGSQVFALVLKSTEDKNATQQNTNIVALTNTNGQSASPVLSSNGDHLAFLFTHDRKLSYQNNQIMLLSQKDGLFEQDEAKALTPELDRLISDIKWQSDSKELVFSYADYGETKLASLSLSGKISPLSARLGSQAMGRPYISGQFALSSSGDIVYTQNNPQRPADLAHLADRNTHLLTQLNEDALGHLSLAKTEAIKIESSVDGLIIDAWIAYPPDFDASKSAEYPMILEIHGGPHAAYGEMFSLEVQLMASAGYVVVWSNPRGSSSYGEDFGNTIHHNYPSDDHQDLMDVVDAVLAKGFVDDSRLFITGGSGGGVLTAWAVGKTDRFAAAVVAKPVINWMSFTLSADAYPYFSQYWMSDMPWNIPDKLWKHSPLSLVGNVNTPTMLLTGEADYRTPISETEQYYQALQLAGVDTAMVRIPGASHSIAARPTHLMQKVGNILAWFEKYDPKSDDASGNGTEK